MLVLGRVSWPLTIILIPECFGIWGKDSLIRRFGRYKNAAQIMSKNTVEFMGYQSSIHISSGFR